MKTMKKGLCLCLCLLLVSACSLFAFAAEEPAAASALRFGEDGKFTILHLTDTQDDQYPAHDLKPFLEKAIETAKPDLIVFTGDLVEDSRPGDFKDDFGVWEGVKILGSTEKTRENAFKAADYVLSIFEESGVPFAVTQGNNDYKVGIYNAEWEVFYKKYPHCVTADMSEDSDGIDYRLPILASDTADVKWNLYCMDTGTREVGEQSLNWYLADSEAQKELNGKTVPALVFQHIPVAELSRLFVPCGANDPRGVTAATLNGIRHFKLADTAHGYYDTVYHSDSGESAEFAAWKKQGDVVAAFFGHMHQDGYSGTVDGIELNMTYGCEFAKSGPYGMRVITLKEAGGAYDNQIYSYQNGAFAEDPFDAPEKTTFQKAQMFFNSLLYLAKTIIRKVLPV